MSDVFEAKRRILLLSAVLIILTLISFGGVVYLYSGLASLHSRLTEESVRRREFERLIETARLTAPVFTVTLQWFPNYTIRYAPPNSVIFLNAFMTIGNLTQLLYPCTIQIQFQAVAEKSNLNGTVTFQYTRTQSVNLQAPVTIVEVPWGAYPIIIRNFKHGDLIRFKVTAYVTVVWSPVEAVIVNQTSTAIFDVMIVKSG